MTSSRTRQSRPAVVPLGLLDLDPLDRRIIAELVAFARMSNRQLADRVGVAPSTALMRTQALVERGVITGFSADIDLAAVGRPVQALVAVTLQATERVQLCEFADAVSGLPEVVATFLTAGSADYLFHVALPSTAQLQDWVFEHLMTSDVVAHVETTLVFNHLAGNAAMLPVDD